MAKNKIIDRYPDIDQIKIDHDGIVTYKGNPRGRVFEDEFKTMNDGRDPFWRHSKSKHIFYSRLGAAVDLVRRG